MMRTALESPLLAANAVRTPNYECDRMRIELSDADSL